MALKALQYENIVLQKELQDLKEATKTEESSGQGTFFQRKSTLTQLKEAVSRMEKAKSFAAAEKHVTRLSRCTIHLFEPLTQKFLFISIISNKFIHIVFQHRIDIILK